VIRVSVIHAVLQNTQVNGISVFYRQGSSIQVEFLIIGTFRAAGIPGPFCVERIGHGVQPLRAKVDVVVATIGVQLCADVVHISPPFDIAQVAEEKFPVADNDVKHTLFIGGDFVHFLDSSGPSSNPLTIEISMLICLSAKGAPSASRATA
jgi:hypothetical protein